MPSNLQWCMGIMQQPVQAMAVLHLWPLQPLRRKFQGGDGARHRKQVVQQAAPAARLLQLLQPLLLLLRFWLSVAFTNGGVILCVL